MPCYAMLNITVFGGNAWTVSVHPLKKERFVCSSGRGECILFDIRAKTDRNKALQRMLVFNGHTKSISAAFLSPLTGNKLVTVCYDNKIRIYDASGLEYRNGFPTVTIKHNNETGRWLTKMKVCMTK